MKIMELRAGEGEAVQLSYMPPGANSFFRSDNSSGTTCVFTKGFWFGRMPITLATWKAVMKRECKTYDREFGFARDLSWDDMFLFCDLVYQANAERLPRGYTVSLPTQFQWERAFKLIDDDSATTVYPGSCDHERATDLTIVTSGGDSGIVFPANFNEYCLDAPLDWSPLFVVNPRGDFRGVARSTRCAHLRTDTKITMSRSYGCGPTLESIRSPWEGFRLAVHPNGPADRVAAKR